MLTVNLSLDKSNINPYISSTLLSKIEEALLSGKKTILYLNKRGEYSSLICQDCQHIYKCEACDTTMNVHRFPEKLRCHLCGYSENISLSCEKCQGNNLVKVGVGTQQIESSLKKYFSLHSTQEEGVREGNLPSIFRFDLDNIKNKTDKKKALENLAGADIIIGTKMITTGFDFKKVAVIGIILIEQELGIPAYNTEEKAYINIKQIMGRGSRVGEKTDFILQSFIPDNDIVKSIINSNYKDFFINTLEERKLFNYPPFSGMAVLEFRDKNKQKASDFIKNLKNKLDLINTENKEIILNPNPRKKYNQYYYTIIIKGEDLRVFLSEIKNEIMRNSCLSLSFEH